MVTMGRDGQIKIGVLALQGAINLHRPHIEALGAKYVEVVTGDHLHEVDGLILPGGESGTMLKLMKVTGISDALSIFLKEKPAWGICAGAILMAKSVTNPEQEAFAAIDIEIERNAYGRQVDSTEDFINGYGVSYIRAPRILRVGQKVEVFAKREGYPTWVESGNTMVTTFHPEINLKVPSPWHKKLFDCCKKISAQS
jgi:5'-phosphate synthase pdxT subunit